MTLAMPEPAPVAESILDFLAQDAEKELLRFLTAGSVDDGKSTLIGRLLYDAKGVYEDQLAAVQKSKVNRSAGALDFSLLTDGLRAEREQGITIDVAYRYFSTPRRKFIIADAPGHEQYTRNMVTGASNSELSIILLDARKGVLEQTRRHAYLAWLLGIRHVVLAVNKMDLVGYDEQVFLRHESEFRRFASALGLEEVSAIPISALEGDNVVERSRRMPWYAGPTLLEKLETVPVSARAGEGPFRFPVQFVIRPDDRFRGYAGRIVAGSVRPGQEVVALPSGQRTRIRSIVTFDGDLSRATEPESVTLTLEDELDLSRGEMLSDVDHPPIAGRKFQAMLVWMQPQPLVSGRTYLLKHTTRHVQARVSAIHHRINIHTLEPEPAEKLAMNDIAYVTVETSRPLLFDSYRENRNTGAFILIDPIGDNTMAAGMITGAAGISNHAAMPEVGTSAHGAVSLDERRARSGHPPVVILLRHWPELGAALERALFERRYSVKLVDPLPPGVSREAAVRLLHDAGLIGIFTVPPGESFSQPESGVPHWRIIDDSHLDLPEGPDAAIGAILKLLETVSALDAAGGAAGTQGREDLDFAEGI